MRRLIAVVFALLLQLEATPSAQADSPRTKLTGTPRLHGREVPELILLQPIQVGRELPRGLPTTMTFRMLPNRFVPVAEDRDGIYFEAVGRVSANGVGSRAVGRLWVSKTRPDIVFAYLGDARHRSGPLSLIEPLTPKDLQKLRTGRPLQSESESALPSVAKRESG